MMKFTVLHSLVIQRMDSITHIALGAVIGEACIGKQIGKKAMLLGAAAQSLPDIDFIAATWLNTSENLLAHRGFTHSFLFVLTTSVFLGFVSDRWHRSKAASLTAWIGFFILQMTVHLLIDACNAYGVGWLEPFSHHRFAFHLLFVADPFFSIPLGLAAVVLLVLTSENASRKYYVIGSLVISSLYLVYVVYNKRQINHEIVQILKSRQIDFTRLLTTPTPLNNWLWFFAAEADSGFYVGHRSVFDDVDSLELTFFPQNTKALDLIHDHEEVQHLIRFSQGFYTVEIRNDKLLFNDLRFGQITGWATPNEKFVFHYYLEHPEDNTLVVQRGRFANWNAETIRMLWVRIFRDR